MALSRRTGQRFQASIWPGFVDAMTGLLLVLMFVLTIFMMVQFVLRETISGQENELDALTSEVAALASALGLSERENETLQNEVGALSSTLSDTETDLAAARGELASQSALILSLTSERDRQRADLETANRRITDFERQVANLLTQRDNLAAERDTLAEQRNDLAQERTSLLQERVSLTNALAQTRDEVDAQTEAARLAAAQREALEALIADLEARSETLEGAVEDLQAREEALAGDVDRLQDRLGEEETARLAEAAAAEALRARLEDADTELTAMTLALEAQRKEAEETLTLLAAARAAREDLTARLTAALEEVESTGTSAAEREELARRLADALAAQETAEADAADTRTLAEERAALLAVANEELSRQEALTAEERRQTELLNQQVAALRTQLGELQALLDDAQARDAVAQVQLQSLGSELNVALARVAAEERRRRELEEAERARLEAERERLEAEARAREDEAERLSEQSEDLERYRSEFFGRLRDVLGDQEGVRVVGDRFVFSSEVLFPPGSADLSIEGQTEIAKVASILRSVASEIPEGLDWIIRVDGHTDDIPLSGFGAFSDNWELSQGRALSVVRYMVDALEIPPQRLSANGFGEYQPVNPEDTPEARAQNRRIEFKLTER